MWGENEVFEEIILYPADIRKGILGGFGLFKGGNPNLLFGLEDMIKLYPPVGLYYPFMFFGKSFYFDGVSINPLKIKNSGEIENENINPLLKLISITPENKWKKNFFKNLLERYVENEFDTNSIYGTFNKNIFDRILFRNEKKMVEKYLRRAINDFIELHLPLIRDLFSLAKVSNDKSSLKVFTKLEKEITNPSLHERVYHREFMPFINIKGIEIQFKLLGNPKIVNTLLKKLKILFKETKIIYDPVNKKHGSKLYKISSIIDTNDPDGGVIMLENILKEFFYGIIEETTITDDLAHYGWHLSKKYMFVKRIFADIVTPAHFKNIIIESLKDVGFYVIPVGEECSRNDLKLNLELWCDYQVFKSKNLLATKIFRIIEKDIEDIDKEIYEKVFPRNFYTDLSAAFMTIRERIKNKFGTVPFLF